MVAFPDGGLVPESVILDANVFSLQLPDVSYEPKLRDVVSGTGVSPVF